MLNTRPRAVKTKLHLVAMTGIDNNPGLVAKSLPTDPAVPASRQTSVDAPQPLLAAREPILNSISSTRIKPQPSVVPDYHGPPLPSPELSSRYTNRHLYPDVVSFIKMQSQITRLRLQVQERRKKLRTLRSKVSDTDRQLMDALRIFWATGTTLSDDTLRILYNQCNAARDEVGPMEDEYETLELQLNGAEFALDERFQEMKMKPIQTPYSPLPMEDNVEKKSVFSFVSDTDEDDEESEDIAQLHGVKLGATVPIGQIPNAQNQDYPRGSPKEKQASSRLEPSLPKRYSAIHAAEERDELVPHGGDLLLSLDFTAPDLACETTWNPLDTINDPVPAPGTDYDLCDSRSRESDIEDINSLLPDASLDPSESKGTFQLQSSWLQDRLFNFENPDHRVRRWLRDQFWTSPWDSVKYEKAHSGLWSPLHNDSRDDTDSNLDFHSHPQAKNAGEEVSTTSQSLNNLPNANRADDAPQHPSLSN